MPCNSPSWGTQTAIDLTTRKIVWQYALGTTRDTGPFGTHNNLPLKTGIFNIGGNMVTRGDLIFQAGTADHYLRAMDVSTGRIVWKSRLPAGGHSGCGTRSGDYLIAYALKR